jgi:hypothetical protein
MTDPTDPDAATLIAMANDMLALKRACAVGVFELPPLVAVQVAGMLQLALRHPGAAASDAAASGRLFVEAIKTWFRENGCLAVVEVLERGDNPEYDVARTHTHTTGRRE